MADRKQGTMRVPLNGAASKAHYKAIRLAVGVTTRVPRRATIRVLLFALL